MRFYFLLLDSGQTGLHMGSAVESETKDEFWHQLSESKVLTRTQLAVSAGISTREEDNATRASYINTDTTDEKRKRLFN